MSDIDLRNFVDININPHEPSEIISTRDTIVLFTPYGTLGEINTYSNLSEAVEKYAEGSTTYKYLKSYFDNGGIKVEVHEGIGYDSLTVDIIKDLPNNLICITCLAEDEDIEDCYSSLKGLANDIIEAVDENGKKIFYGINEKIIIARTFDYTVDYETKEVTVDLDKIKNFAVKFSEQTGAEMTIAAYLSQIDVNAENSIFDYAFTEEKIEAENLLSNIANSLYEAIINANMNIDIYLAGEVRNCGGNCKDGYDLTNSYVRIILHQTLTDQLIQLLTQKIKGQDGISKIYTVIAQELEKYKNCGYLTTDKIWTDKPLVIEYNKQVYTIVRKGDALLNGYIIKVLPMSSLTEEDKKSNSIPPIYVIIADQYGIRKITINGEVI